MHRICHFQRKEEADALGNAQGDDCVCCLITAEVWDNDLQSKPITPTDVKGGLALPAWRKPHYKQSQDVCEEAVVVITCACTAAVICHQSHIHWIGEQ